MKNKAFVNHSREWIAFHKIPLLLVSLLLILVGSWVHFVLGTPPEIVHASHFFDRDIIVSNQSPSTGGGWQMRGNHDPAEYHRTGHTHQSGDVGDYGEHRWDIWESREITYGFTYRYTVQVPYSCGTPEHPATCYATETRNGDGGDGHIHTCGYPLSSCNSFKADIERKEARGVANYVPGSFRFKSEPAVADPDPNVSGERTEAREDHPPLPYEPSSTESLYDGRTPFLAIGHDRNFENPQSDGYHSPYLKIDLWIKESSNNGTVTLFGEDFCGSSGLDTAVDPGEFTTIHIEGSHKEKGRKKGRRIGGIWSSLSPGCSSSVIFPIGGFDKNKLESRYLIDYASRDTTPRKYHKYVIVAERDEDSMVGSYYNQFRLKVTSPANTGDSIDSLLSFRRTARGDGASSSDAGHNVLGISNRINETASMGRLEDMFLLWEITFDVAGPAEEGCSKTLNGKVGLYDHDYDQARNWQEDNDLNPKIDIWRIDRNDYLDQITERPGEINQNWEFWLTVDFNGELEKNLNESSNVVDRTDVSRNAWENRKLPFDNSKIYRLRFYNLNSPSWVQARVPFSQINTLQKCVGKPLFKVRYADISAGGRFGLGDNIDACENQSLSDIRASIYGHANSQRGSSADYAARAHDDIHGFYSDYPEGPPPGSFDGLTFANSPENLPYGGNLGIARCLPNFWRESDRLQPREPGEEELDLAAAAGNRSLLYRPASGTLTLKNSSPDSSLGNLKTTVYVDGDLRIADDIVNNAVTWSSFNQIGYIVLIAKGNVYIDPSVGRLDAIVVAYSDNPGDATAGHIYTCYATAATAKGYHDECKQKRLVMHGALIGQAVHLGRTLDENDVGDGVTEEILLAPEYFVGSPQLPTFANWIYHSDSVTVLPPNF